MSKRTFLPAIAIFLVLLAFPQTSRSQSAIGQLETMTGQQIGRFHPTTMRAPVGGGMGAMGGLGAIRGMGGMMLMQGVIGLLLDGMAQQAAGQQEAAARAEMQAWMAAEQQRLASLVKQQRVKRDAENYASDEEMKKAMGDGFDTPMPPADLASALRDPVIVEQPGAPAHGTVDSKVVDLRPNPNASLQITADSNVVDFRDMDRKPAVKADPKPIPQSPTVQKIQKMIQENQNPAKLDQNLKKLEDRLAELQRLSEKMAAKDTVSPQDLAKWNTLVGQISQEGMQRGLSLAMDYGSQGASGGAQELLSRLKEQKANPAKWKQTLEHLNNLNDFAEFSEGLSQKGRPDLSKIDWNRAKANLNKDLDDTISQFKSQDQKYQSGKDMIDKSLDMAQAREQASAAAQKGGQLSPFFWDKKKQIDAAAEKLASVTDKVRQNTVPGMQQNPTPKLLRQPEIVQKIPPSGGADYKLLNPLIELPKGQSLPNPGETAEQFYQRFSTTPLAGKIAKDYNAMMKGGDPEGLNIDEARIWERENVAVKAACRKAVQNMNAEWDQMAKQGLFRPSEDLKKKEETDVVFRNALMQAHQRVYGQFETDLRVARTKAVGEMNRLQIGKGTGK